MGAYIKNFKMPPPGKYRACVIVDEFGARLAVDVATSYADRDLRVDPIIPVPPHGRLIDAAARVNVQMYNDEFEDFQTVNMSIDDLLDSSWIELEDDPTIIPAEEARL